MDEEIIYSLPFSIELFKLLPYNPSLEVIIKDDGVILYARPSHTEALIPSYYTLEDNALSTRKFDKIRSG